MCTKLRGDSLKRHLRPLDDTSYAHIARRLRRVADELESADPMVLDRALTDMINFVGRIKQQRPGNLHCPRCDLMVAPRLDRGDSLCPQCGLVL